MATAEIEKALDIPGLQWFPGHMKKARHLIEDNLKLVDVVIELLDARIPASSANPMLREILGEKPRVIALNKADLSDPAATARWMEYFSGLGIPAAAIDAVKGKGIKQLTKLAEDLARPRTDKLVSKGAKPRAARAMILGIPNVGKSSLINRLAGSARTKTENRPGVTRAKQWIRIGSRMELLDTPGILWPKFESPMAALRLAFTGAIRDEIYDLEQVACLLLEFLASRYPDDIRERFKWDQALPVEGLELLELVGKKRGCLIKGGSVDTEKAAHIAITEFRSGKLGRITLDPVPSET